MNILLWILQVLMALFCVAGGTYKITHFEQLQAMNASMRALPQVFWTCVGGLETLAGLGLIFPAAAKVVPVLTPVAAACMAVESLLITLLYVYFHDFSPAAFTVVGGLVAAFIAYGRFVLKPF